jgi:hypothetical protein
MAPGCVTTVKHNDDMSVQWRVGSEATAMSPIQSASGGVGPAGAP